MFTKRLRSVLILGLVAAMTSACDDDAGQSSTPDTGADSTLDSVAETSIDTADPDGTGDTPSDTGEGCTEGSECESGVCDVPTGACVDPTCEDGVSNGDETGVDCGGPTCDACGNGQDCDADGDCESGSCTNGSCAALPTCDDEAQNGTETGVDCGGDTCDPCTDGGSCVDASDCASSVCDAGTCAAASCVDGTLNGGETAVDCGGSECEGCADGEACVEGSDCGSGVCDSGSCTAPTCEDNVQNGTETDTDCGGDTCGGCGDDAACEVNEDCQSAQCDALGKVCVPADCADAEQNGEETDQDCGGSVCAGCGTGLSCVSGDDCLSSVCDTENGSVCLAAACDDGVENGDESDVDCGGSCSPCDAGGKCVNANDCLSSVCNSQGVCLAAACDDGVENGTETDADCGGDTCDACLLGESCSANEDCEGNLLCGSSSTCVYATDCLELYLERGVTTSGVQTIDPDGPSGNAAFNAWCDMESDGGGWTLLMKSTGDCTFNYASEVWTTNNVVNETDLTLADANAKYPAFNASPYTSVRAVWPDLSHTMTASWETAMTALDRFQTGEVLADDPDAFYSEWPAQEGFVEYGFNGACGSPQGNVRWGWNMNNEAICSSNDAGAGIGMACADTRAAGMGGWGTCCVTSGSIGNFPSRVLIYGRDGDPCANGQQDAGETDVDCGGLCGACSDGASCTDDTDCGRGVCDSGTCVSCFDGAQNADETDVDCGGRCAAQCSAGQGCNENTECDTGICSSSTCADPLESCLDLLIQGGITADGVYVVDPDGAGAGDDPAAAWCDMTSEGGGWTMLLKGTGDCTFDYESEYWTTANVLNETDTTLDAGNAKYPAFNTLAVTELWAQWPDIPHAMTASWTGALTALDRFQTEADLGMSAGQHSSAWPTQSGYQQYGFNLTCVESASVRWGWAFNNETDCSSNDTGSGIGLNCVSGNRNTDMGAWLTCCPADASFALGNYDDRVRVFGREFDPCADGVKNGTETDVDCGGACGVACDVGEGCNTNEECVSSACEGNICADYKANCQELFDVGNDTNGVYTLDLDGSGGADPAPSLCNMEDAGGGWTLLMKSNGDCTFQYTADYWTTANVLSETDVSPSAGNAKYPAFNSLALTEVMATWPTLGHTMQESWTGAQTALNRFQIFADIGADTGDPMAQFYSSWPRQDGYQQYGFNVDCGPSWGRVRWGWQMNNEATCDSNDAGAGIGLACEGTNRQAASGGFVTCCPANAVTSPAEYPAPVMVWGR